MFDLVKHLFRQREFSLATFGPGKRRKGVADHIRKELDEIEADPEGKGECEWIDVIILGFDGALRDGRDPEEIVRLIVAKQAKNEGRIWPDWRLFGQDQAIEHDRSGDMLMPLDTPPPQTQLQGQQPGELRRGLHQVPQVEDGQSRYPDGGQDGSPAGHGPWHQGEACQASARRSVPQIPQAEEDGRVPARHTLSRGEVMTSTPEQVITNIREALEAGPYEGPWTLEEFQHDGRPCAIIVSASETIIAEIRGYTDSCGNGENARFIAACNPQNIAVLLAEIDALRLDVERHVAIAAELANAPAALQSAADTPASPPPSSHLPAYPQELTDDLRDILSMMMWNTGPIAHALRDGGQDIKRKAEEEQAEVMHWLIGLALEHGGEWRAKASDRIREIRDALAATATEGQP